MRANLRYLVALITLFLLPASSHAGLPGDKDLDAAIHGNFGGFYAQLSAWLDEKTAAAGKLNEESLRDLLKDPVAAGALSQRQFIAKIGPKELGDFAKADAKNQIFLGWLLRNTLALDLYLEAASASGVKEREANTYRLNIASLELWRKLFDADADSKQGIYLKLAIATALWPPPATSYGSGLRIDPIERYKQFKTAHQNKELFPSFDYLSVWDMENVVNSWASDRELVWVRQMVTTWRPDLRSDTKVIQIVSEVWRRNSPIPFSEGFISVLAGGGKCGPRSWFGEMACKAFGLPSRAMGQPAHSAVAYKSPDPAADPQPGSSWKICHGRGWNVTVDGYALLSEAAARDRVELFSKIEHCTWLASAIADKTRAAAILDVVHELQKQIPVPGNGPNPAIGPKGELIPIAVANPAKPQLPPANLPDPPSEAAPGVLQVDAASFVKSFADAVYPGEEPAKISVFDCALGGKQVNFQKLMKTSWIEFSIGMPMAGTYELTMRAATPNLEQVLEVSSGDAKLATIKVPNTTGLWGTTPPVDIKLESGKQMLRFTAPQERGIAIRWFELKPKK